MQFVKLMKLLNVSNFDVIVGDRENLQNKLAILLSYCPLFSEK